MTYVEEELEEELILKRYKENSKQILRVPREFEINRKRITRILSNKGVETREELWPYGGVVPGRKHYPTNKSIPLKIYNGRRQPPIPTRISVKVVFQKIIKYGIGKITLVDYIVTDIEPKDDKK